MTKQPHFTWPAMAATAAALTLIVCGIGATPAEARYQCIYVATNGKGWAVATQGTARRSSTACRRAERRCNRKLKRAKRRGRFNRSVTPSCRKHSGRGASF